MIKPRLSICIATYNRSDFISATLDSIISQLTDEVEIVVVDGGSTDSTSEIVSAYSRLCQNLRYIRLAAKGGVDQDYCKSVELAKGEYCWLFTDDDLLKPGAIRTVLGALRGGFSLMVVNADVYDKSFSIKIQSRRMPIGEDEVYFESELAQFFRRVVPFISFIGCVVVQRDMWLRREKAKYYGSEFIHLGVIFQAPLTAPALVIAEPCISIRLGNSQWSPRAYEIWMVKWPKLLLSFDHIPLKTRKDLGNSTLLNRIGNLLNLRATGAYSFEQFNAWFDSKTSHALWRLIAFSLLLFPAFSLNFILLCFLKLLRKNSRIAIYHLETNTNNLIMPRH